MKTRPYKNLPLVFFILGIIGLIYSFKMLQITLVHISFLVVSWLILGALGAVLLSRIFNWKLSFIYRFFYGLCTLGSLAISLLFWSNLQFTDSSHFATQSEIIDLDEIKGNAPRRYSKKESYFVQFLVDGKFQKQIEVSKADYQLLNQKTHFIILLKKGTWFPIIDGYELHRE